MAGILHVSRNVACFNANNFLKSIDFSFLSLARIRYLSVSTDYLAHSRLKHIFHLTGLL